MNKHFKFAACLAFLASTSWIVAQSSRPPSGNVPGTPKPYVVDGGGSKTANNCAKWDAAGNLVDAGAACGTGSTAPVNWDDIEGKPETFSPSSHTHTSSQISDLSTNAVTSLQGSAGALTFPAPGTTGTAPNWSGLTVHIPMASASSVTAGLISKSQYDGFEVKSGKNTANGYAGLDGSTKLNAAHIPNNSADTSGNASTATALAANGTNCPEGEFSAGVDASGNAEGCAAPAGGSSSVTTKGDLQTYDTASARLPVGSNGQVLTADSAQSTGLKWEDRPLSIILCSHNAIIAAGGSGFICHPAMNHNGTFSNRALPSAYAGTIKNVRGKILGANQAGGSLTCTLYVAGSSTSIVLTWAASAANGTSASDTSNTASIAVDDSVALSCSNGTSGNSPFIAVNIPIYP